jgi:hypothetical protein
VYSVCGARSGELDRLGAIILFWSLLGSKLVLLIKDFFGSRQFERNERYFCMLFKNLKIIMKIVNDTSHNHIKS